MAPSFVRTNCPPPHRPSRSKNRCSAAFRFRPRSCLKSGRFAHKLQCQQRVRVQSKEMSDRWMEPPKQVTLAENEAHVWLAHLPVARKRAEPLTNILSPDELARADKFHFAEHRERWQTTRAILRCLLAHNL